jgi:hypothetical protein
MPYLALSGGNHQDQVRLSLLDEDVESGLFQTLSTIELQFKRLSFLTVKNKGDIPIKRKWPWC